MEKLIDTLPKKTSFYRGEDGHGGLKILRPLQRMANFHSAQLIDNACVAAALTELCCDTGIGKVCLLVEFLENHG